MSRDSLPPLEDEFTRALLGSAESDAPTPAAYAKAAAALGVGVSIGAASIPAAAAVGAAGFAGIARWSSSLSAKLFFGFSGALLVGGAGALLARNLESPKAMSPSGAVHVPAVARPAGQSVSVAPALAVRDRSRAPVPSGAPTAASPTATRAGEQGQASLSPMVRPFAASAVVRRVAHPGPSPAAADPHAPLAHEAADSAAAPARAPADFSLAVQVQSLDRARVALAAGDSASTLAEIARYRAAWPNGVFLTEASVLEIEALAASGQRARARAGAAEFVAAHPDSPQADRLRALIPHKKP